jgi:hypothetical protein
MAPEKNHKQAQETMLEEPIVDRLVSPESIGEEEPRIGRTKMSTKVKGSNGARSIHPGTIGNPPQNE